MHGSVGGVQPHVYSVIFNGCYERFQLLRRSKAGPQHVQLAPSINMREGAGTLHCALKRRMADLSKNGGQLSGTVRTNAANEF